MKKHALSTVAVSALLAALATTAVAQNVAIVNGQAVPKARVDALTQQVERSGRKITPELESQIKEEVILREVFGQEAHSLGLDTTDDFKTQVEFARQTVLIRELFTNFQNKNPVTDEETKAEYDRYVAANAGKEYHARHILVAKEADAKDIIAKLKNGAKFEDLAKKLSKDPGSGAKGGDLDWASPGNFVKEFSDAMVALGKGKFTETPVKTQFGYHVIRLDDVRDTQLPKYEDVKAQITQQLQQQKLGNYQKSLRDKAKIE